MKRLAGCSILMVSLVLLAPQVSVSALAQECVRYFLEEHLPNPHQLPLPWKVVEAIRNHPISDWAKSLGPSEQIYFSVTPAQNLNGALSKVYIGEEIQGEFLRKVVRSLFPESQIDLPNPSFKPKFKFKLKVRDSIESHERGIVAAAADYIDMPILKAANASLSAMNKAESRALLKIAPEQRVGVIYSPGLVLKDAPVSKDPSIRSVYRTLKGQGITSLILSPNPRSIRIKPQEMLDAIRKELPHFLDQFDSVIFLAQAKADEMLMPEGKKILVINNTMGKTPYIYSAADLVVVQGPVNPLESVTVGTPTVVFLNDRVVGHYDLDGYSRIVNYGLATGKAQAVHNVSDLEGAIEKLNRYEGPVLTPDQVKVGGKTALERFLDVLHQKLQRQAELPL